LSLKVEVKHDNFGKFEVKHDNSEDQRH